MSQGNALGVCGCEAELGRLSNDIRLSQLTPTSTLANSVAMNMLALVSIPKSNNHVHVL